MMPKVGKGETFHYSSPDKPITLWHPQERIVEGNAASPNYVLQYFIAHESWCKVSDSKHVIVLPVRILYFDSDLFLFAEQCF